MAGWPDREPADLGHYTDFIAPRYNALAILAALDYRRRTGKGVHLDMAQFEGCVNFIAPIILDYTANKRIDGRHGNRVPNAAPHGAFKCFGTDRWCVIGVQSDMEWKALRRLMGNPAWAKDPRFATLLGRKENEDELEKLVETWTVTQTPEQVMEKLQAAGVAAGIIADGKDMYDDDPQLKFRKFYADIEPAEMGPYFTVAPPYKLSKVGYEIKPAPLMGEHNEYVFKQILGMSDEEIADLIAEGVVE